MPFVSVAAIKSNQPTTMTHEKLREAFMQGGAREATDLFNEVIRGSVREAFWQMMAEEVESLCGKRYHPDPDCSYQRAGSETGSVYLDGEKETIRRPRVRHEADGEVRLESYRAASSQAGLFEEIVGLVGEGMSQRGLERGLQMERIARVPSRGCGRRKAGSSSRLCGNAAWMNRSGWR